MKGRPARKNCANQVAVMTAVMPRSGCFSSTNTTRPKTAMAIRLPGTRCSLILSENIQAAKIAKVGFRNSEGCKREAARPRSSASRP